MTTGDAVRTVEHGPWDGYGALGGHRCDVRRREHYEPCGCPCGPCTAARTPCAQFTTDVVAHAHDLGSIPCLNCGRRFQEHPETDEAHCCAGEPGPCADHDWPAPDFCLTETVTVCMRPRPCPDHAPEGEMDAPTPFSLAETIARRKSRPQ